MIYWPAEESVSVVKYGDILHPTNPTVGCECRVKAAKKTYAGRLAATGKCDAERIFGTVHVVLSTCPCIITRSNIIIAGSSIEMSALEERYVAGEWTPFSANTNKENTILGERKSADTGEEPAVNCVPREPGASPKRISKGKVQNKTKRTKSGKLKGVDRLHYCAVC